MRLSLVQYLNSAPLGWGFTRGPLQHRARVLLSTPAECAAQLQSGQVEAGLIPIVEYQRIPGLSIIPEISIASQGKTRSVLLVSRVPVGKIRTVALDESSRTSALLVQVLLARVFELEPRYESSPPELAPMLASHDAALIIGDPALEVLDPSFTVYDLGELWSRWSGLPFVFAFWAVRPSPEVLRMAPLFDMSRQYGLEHLDEICEHYSGRLAMTAEEIREYLTVNIDFDLSARHVKGLRLFFDLAHEQGLLPAPRPLEFLAN